MRHINILFLLSAIALPASTFTTNAQENKEVANPQPYILKPFGRATSAKPELLFKSPSEAKAAPEVQLDMNVKYLERQIYNPANGGYDKVRLRGYEDVNRPQGDDVDAPLVGPTIDTRPGQTIRVTLNNMLPEDSTCDIGDSSSANIPHCFNGTNLHSHGLWVNPSGNSDNVLISIRPGVNFQYEYNIPSDHPSGTFWYHPHLHGSTALQVSSGMSGAIIIRGDRLPTPSSNGDIDTLLKNENGMEIEERVLVLQQIQYACLNEQRAITYDCKEDQVGGIENYDQFGPGTWQASGRFTSVNGQVLGRLAPAKVGAVERWRMIHAGVRDTINFELRRKRGDASIRSLRSGQSESWIEENCSSETIPYGVMAQDGLTMNHVQMRDQAILQPGYRVDALVTFPEAGEYCVIDAAAPAEANINQNEPSRRLLGVVTAAGGETISGPIEEYLQNWLIGAAERTMPEDIVDQVISDLSNQLQLNSFIPHPDITDDEVTGYQELVFNIDVTQPGATFFEIDGKPYSHGRIDRNLVLGGVDEWKLESDFVSHPFHIHVNPFQVIKILDSEGRDVSEFGATDGADPQYPGLKGVWKDTLWVKNPGFSAASKYTIVVRTRYQRYIGDFVLHCHILDHEDQGMMQNVRISLPDGNGGIAASHH